MKESILRTVVPILYAVLVNLGVVEWLGVQSAAVEGLLTLIVTGAIYVTLRLIERHKESLGWLLGYPAQPEYRNHEDPSA